MLQEGDGFAVIDASTAYLQQTNSEELLDVSLARTKLSRGNIELIVAIVARQ